MATVLHAPTTRHEEWGGPKRYVRIVVHDTTADFRRAATTYRPQTDWSESAGGFSPAPDRERYVGGEWVNVTPPHWAGLMRLSLEAIGSEVVTHECVHAAAAIYRMDICAGINLGHGCGRREESLAYIIGDLTGQVANALHQAGLWP